MIKRHIAASMTAPEEKAIDLIFGESFRIGIIITDSAQKNNARIYFVLQIFFDRARIFALRRQNGELKIKFLITLERKGQLTVKN